MSYAPDPKHREFAAFVMICGCGFAIHWNTRDPLRDGFVYGAYTLWRHERWRWAEFYKWTFGSGTTLEYSEGKKGKQIVRWQLTGPLVRFEELSR